METLSMPMPMVHIFEAAGLGKGPFTYVRVVTGGTHCQYCNTPIVYQFWLKGADGKLFFVGSDCVMKTGDAGLIKIVDAEVKRHQKALRVKREQEKLAKIKAQLDDPKVRAVLATKEHPSYYYRTTKTLADYCDYVWKYGGKTGRMQLAGKIERALNPPAPIVLEDDENTVDGGEVQEPHPLFQVSEGL